MMTSSRVLYRVESDMPALTLSDIRWDSARHVMAMGEMSIALTPAEYRLLFPLRQGRPVTFARLAYEIYNYAFDERVRTMMDKHIDRVRSKLRGSGVYVYCVVGYGYMLLPIPTAENVHGLVSFE